MQIIPQTLLPLDFSFFPKIVFNISENKLDTIFTVAWIYSMDVRAEACPLTSEAAPREIKASHRNYLAPEPWPGGKKCRREWRNLKNHAHLLLFKNSPEISQVRDSWVTTKKLWRQVKRDDRQTWSEHKGVLWPFQPLSQSDLMAESKSHWWLTSWSDDVTHCVTVRAFAGDRAFAVWSDRWQPFRKPS